jgi:hypothetical protein
MDIVLEAKKELSKQLNDVMITFLYTGIRTIWASSREKYELEVKDKKQGVLKIFQERLSMIPRWNQNIINSEYERLLNQTDKIEPEFIDKLIEALFISHIQVLSSIKLNSKNNKLNVKIPNSKNFVHKCYIECARRFYTEPSLFEDRRNKCSSVSIQKNLNLCYKIIIECIEKTVRNTLPIRSILEEALLASESEPEPENNETDSESDSDSEEETPIEDNRTELPKATRTLSEGGGTLSLLSALPDATQFLHPEFPEATKLSPEATTNEGVSAFQNLVFSDPPLVSGVSPLESGGPLDVINGESLQNSLDNEEEIEIFFDNDSEYSEPLTEVPKVIESEGPKPTVSFNIEENLPEVEVEVEKQVKQEVEERRIFDGFFSDAESE